MVLRFLPLIFSVLISLSVHALTPYDKALKYYKEKKYNSSLKVLAKNYKIKNVTNRTPQEVYELVGRIFIKRKKFKVGINFFRYAIKSRYNNIDREAMRTYFRQGNADGLDELPEKLYKYYFLILGTSVHYANHLIKNGMAPNQTLTQYVEVFGNILLEADYKTKKVEKLMKNYEGKIQEIERQEYKSNWFITTGYISWQDRVTFTDTDGKEYDLIAPAEGIGLGVGWQKHNFYWGYKFEFRYSSLSANAGFDGTNISYFQENVSVSFIGIEAGIFTLPFTGDVGIGLSVPIFYKNGDYTAPTGTEIEGASKISTGLIVEGLWYKGNYSLTSQVGKIVGLTSAYWGVHVSYHF